MNNFKKWIPNNDIPSFIYSMLTIYDNQSLIFTFEDEVGQKILTIIFDSNDVISYKETEEKSFMKTSDLAVSFNLLDWPLFKVENSDYLKWLKKESLNMYAENKIDHYLFYANDIITEVLSLSEPKIEVLIKVN